MTKIAKQRLMPESPDMLGYVRVYLAPHRKTTVLCTSYIKTYSSQFIDDTNGKSLVQVSSLDKNLKEACKGKNKLDISVELGKLAAEKAKEAGIESVVFDRGGYLYHGRVKALADSAREAGLKF